MTQKELLGRRAQIMSELSHMSKDGWKNAKPYDYLPLEKELRLIEPKIRRFST